MGSESSVSVLTNALMHVCECGRPEQGDTAIELGLSAHRARSDCRPLNSCASSSGRSKSQRRRVVPRACRLRKITAFMFDARVFLESRASFASIMHTCIACVCCHR